jgi:hypothetical protein
LCWRLMKETGRADSEGWIVRFDMQAVCAIIFQVDGDMAQLGERRVRIAKVGGSNPPISTNYLDYHSIRNEGSLYSP